VIFCDEADHVAARRWCWRQSVASASSSTTTDVLVTVEGHHDGARRDVEAALTDLESLLVTYARPAAIRAGIVDAVTPTFSSDG
jgi:DNA/RNA-binding domain of Phe-tRNA-synthetase-like protein